jgi:nucleotide-binding universal stress UspA family protein
MDEQPAMALFRHILVPTDYSAASERALETAAALATLFGAELTLLHVIEADAQPHPFPVPEGARKAERSRLDETVAGLRARMLSASGLLREGTAWKEICASVAKVSADLVVVGSQGRHGLPRFVLGSVAERLVRLAPVPVLTVHPLSHVAVLAGGMGRFRHILAPTDFSEASQRGTEAAVNLAIELGAALTLVHVYEVPAYACYALDDVAAEVEARLGRDLDELLARVRARFPKAEGVVRQGAAWQGILDVAEDLGADLIVLTTHGRHGVERALVGSVAEKVVRLSQVPVLTVGLK